VFTGYVQEEGVGVEGAGSERSVLVEIAAADEPEDLVSGERRDACVFGPAECAEWVACRSPGRGAETEVVQ